MSLKRAVYSGSRACEDRVVRLAALVLLAGCQRLLDLSPVQLTDANHAPDAPVVGDTSAVDGPQSRFVQDSAASSDSSILTVLLNTPPVANHVLIAIGGSENGVKALSGGGVTMWTLAARSIVSPTVQIWFGETDGSSSTISLSTANPGKIWLEVSEWRGLAPMNTLDAGSGSGGSNVTPGDVSLDVDTQGAPDLLVFGIASYGAIGTPTGSWTALKDIPSSFVTQDAWYQLTSVAGMQAVQAMYNDDYDAALAAFRTMP